MTFPAEMMWRVKVSSCNVCFALSSDGPVLRCGLPFAQVPNEEVAASCKDCTPPPRRCRLREGSVLMELDPGFASRDQVAGALRDDEKLVEYLTNCAAEYLGCSHETAETLLKVLAENAVRAPGRGA